MTFQQLIMPIWNYRELIKANVKRELAAKYKNSVLGFGWAIINPLAMILIYTVIFSHLMQAKLPGVSSEYSYSIYLCSGIITWGLFTEILSRSQNMFLESANLLKKVKFPKICLPAIISSVAVVNFFIIFSLFMIFLIITNQFPGLVTLHMVPVLVIQVLFSISLGMVVAILNVYFRDVGQLFTILTQFWFWLTPIIYPISILPSWLKKLTLTYNPLTPIIKAYQDIIVTKQIPDYLSLAIPTLITVILTIYALYLTKKNINHLIDEL